MMRSVPTRFRAYQLGCPGSSFSYFAGGHFTLLEGRLTAHSRPALLSEMDACGVDGADTLHITSWDADHCSASELEELLDLVRPARVECPGYEPHTANGQTCDEILADYMKRRCFSNRGTEIRRITPEYIAGLVHAEGLAFRHTFYNPCTSILNAQTTIRPSSSSGRAASTSLVWATSSAR
jgi:competence protein ComEC